MPDHLCDKTLMIEQYGKDIANLFEGKNQLTGRMTEMETTLYGAERNGNGGFLKEMRDTAQAVNSTAGLVKMLMDRKTGARSIVVASIPSLIMAIVTIATVILTRGLPK